MSTLSERLRMVGMSHDCDKLMLEAADELDRLTARVAELEAELRNIALAKRFNKEHFDDDSSFADWAQSRARWALEHKHD